MFNPRGNAPPRPRGPNPAGKNARARGQNQGAEPRPGGLQRQATQGTAQRFPGLDTKAKLSGPNVQVTQHRTDPRQARGRQQKDQGHGTRWDTPFASGSNSQNQPASQRIAGNTASAQSRYTSESASSILASFGLSNEDLEELSRYPDDQLTPENMPLILRDIRMNKMARNLSSQGREKETFSSDGRGSMVKSKVIDYGHESKYGYTKSPLEVKVYASNVPSQEGMKGFQAQETGPVTAAPSSIPNNTFSAVEELIRQLGFQRSTPSTQPFYSMNAANKVPGLCLPSAGPVVPPVIRPMMPPGLVLPLPTPPMPPLVQQVFPPPPVAQPMMPVMNQLPPPFVPEILGGVNRQGKIQVDSRRNPPPGPSGGQKTFQKEAENPIESPFGVVKASWLPVFSQVDAQKMKRLPTPSMMNDYYATSPRIFPHMCSLCNVECRHLKDWIQHQNTSAHLESCRQLCQQYPDWNPENHSSAKRSEGDRKDNHTARHRSASPSPKRSRISGSGRGRQRTRSRSRSPGRIRGGRPRSRSPRHLDRSRSPSRYSDYSSWSRGSNSGERGRSRPTDQALEDAVKCLGPHFVEQLNKQKYHGHPREASGSKRGPPEPGKGLGRGKKPPGNPVGPPKPPHSGSSKPIQAVGATSQGGVAADEKNKKLPSGAPTKETSVAAPLPNHRLLTDQVLRHGTVIIISELPNDGYSDLDLKKIVQPFGKVSDILVLRSRNEAYLEMNYKEAAIAAVKFSNTVPIQIGRKHVKISMPERPRGPPKQNKGNPKMASVILKPPASTKKEETVSAEESTNPAAATVVPVPSTSKTNIEKPGEPPKDVEKEPAGAKQSGATKAAEELKKPTDAKKPEEAKKALESKKTLEPKKGIESKQESKITEPKQAVVSKQDNKNIEPKKVIEPKQDIKKTIEPEKVVSKQDIKNIEPKKVVEPKQDIKKTIEPKKVIEPKQDIKKTIEPKKVVEPKQDIKNIEPKIIEPKQDIKNIEPKIIEPKQDVKKTIEPKKAVGPKQDIKKTIEPKKVVESKTKEMPRPAQVPGTSEVVKNTKAGESASKEAEETSVVVVSNLPEAGFTLDDVSLLTKPFGELKDVLIVASHKKALLEISRKSAESLVKFYTCFPKWVETGQLTFAVSSEFKDIKDEEAIFISLIKEANPKVNTETLHAQFVYLGNLPDDGYSELEILCVGLRFGRVDHYMVISNKNKAILQLDSAESAASMCRFLKKYPYSLVNSQLTFSRSPKIEPPTAEVTKGEVKKVEPTKEGPDLKKIPEGSGAAVPSAKPIEAKEEPSSSLKAKIPEGKTEQSGTDKMICETPLKPLKTEASEGSGGIAETLSANTPTDLGSSEIKLKEGLALPPKLEKDEVTLDICNKAELVENVSTSAAGNEGNGLPVRAGELSEELHTLAKAENLGSDSTRTEEREEVTVAPCETDTQDSAEAPVEEVSSGDLQSSSKLPSKADKTESGDASAGSLTVIPAPKSGVVMDKEAEASGSTAEAVLEVQTLATFGETTEAQKKTPELQTAGSEETAEKQQEGLVSDCKPTEEKKPESGANEESSEQIVQKAQPKEENEEAQSEEPNKTSMLATESTPSPTATSASKTILKAVVSASKATTATRKKEAPKPVSKMGTRSQSAAEAKSVPKELSQLRPTRSRANMPDGNKSKPALSSLLVKVGSEKSSSQQEKKSQVETKGSSKQPRERDSRSSSTKRDSSVNKVLTGKSTRSSKRGTKLKEEEELFPFNLDEFVTVDEVTDEVDSPTQSRKNPPRAKKRELGKKSPPPEPSLKRKRGKNLSVCAAEAELSFVTLDEIGDEEAHAAEPLHLGAMPDPQVLVTVDEVNEEEEPISEAVGDPQLLVTLDEISEQEESAAKEAFPIGDSEPDLKAGPLVTVDEIGEVEELPLTEPSHFKVEEKPMEEEKHTGEDVGDFISSRMLDDPSTLVTVDEIHEDGEDQPLVTVDEAAEDDEDFLADFNRLKEDLNFVTVDEVGSEDDAEEKDSTKMVEPVAETGPERKTSMEMAEAEEDVKPAKPSGATGSVKPEVLRIPSETPVEMRVELSEGNKVSKIGKKALRKQRSAAGHLVGATVKKGEDVEKNKMTEADMGCEEPLTGSALHRAESSGDQEGSTDQGQQPSESGSHEADNVGEATEVERKGGSSSTSNEKKTVDEVQMSPDVDRSTADTPAAADELGSRSKEESCSVMTPSPSSEKSRKGGTDLECKEPESKKRKVDSSEKSDVPNQEEDILAPKAGFFCQICSRSFADEPSMKTHFQSQLHKRKAQKFKVKEEEKKEGGESVEEQSSR